MKLRVQLLHVAVSCLSTICWRNYFFSTEYQFSTRVTTKGVWVILEVFYSINLHIYPYANIQWCWYFSFVVSFEIWICKSSSCFSFTRLFWLTWVLFMPVNFRIKLSMSLSGIWQRFCRISRPIWGILAP